MDRRLAFLFLTHKRSHRVLAFTVFPVLFSTNQNLAPFRLCLTVFLFPPLAAEWRNFSGVFRLHFLFPKNLRNF